MNKYLPNPARSRCVVQPYTANTPNIAAVVPAASATMLASPPVLKSRSRAASSQALQHAEDREQVEAQCRRQPAHKVEHQQHDECADAAYARCGGANAWWSQRAHRGTYKRKAEQTTYLPHERVVALHCCLWLRSPHVVCPCQSSCTASFVCWGRNRPCASRV